MIENLFEFVNQPGPNDYLVHCRLTRHKGGLDGGGCHHRHRHRHYHTCSAMTSPHLINSSFSLSYSSWPCWVCDSHSIIIIVNDQSYFLQVILCKQGGNPQVTNWPWNFGSSANKYPFPCFALFVWLLSILLHLHQAVHQHKNFAT